MQEDSFRQTTPERPRGFRNVSARDVVGSLATGAAVAGTSYFTPEITEWLEESTTNQVVLFVGMPTVLTGLYMCVRHKINRQ